MKVQLVEEEAQLLRRLQEAEFLAPEVWVASREEEKEHLLAM
jgi:hypothetical protein